ncbi:MAG: ADP-ribosylglycohydrolase family protein [Myxococcota bacterium]
MQERFEGCVVGLAVGDALGFATEFRRRDDILASFGPAGVTDFVGIQDARWRSRTAVLGDRHPPGTYSDDTQMSLAVAEALLACGDASLEVLMERVAREFVAWSRSPENNRAPGNTCMTACANLARGLPWRRAGVSDSKGCGSAMRVAPIGLRYANDRARLLEVARASSVVTHGHDAAVEGAAAAALLVALALEGASPARMYDEIMRECAPRSADFRTCLEKLPGLLEAPPERALSRRGLGESWVAEEAVAAALYCVWRNPDDFSAGVLMAANTDGDSDSIACIAGSILGARLGLYTIPSSWRSQVENSARLHQVARALHATAR